MTRKTRLFLLTAAGVLVVGLITGLLASYLGLPALALQGANGPDELEYLPADANLIAYANVRDVMNSELRQKLREVRPEGDRHDDFEEKTGINIERDIDLVVAALGDGPDPTQDQNYLVVARGRFDTVRIEGLVREHGGQVSEYQGKRLLMKSEDSHEMAVAFVEPGLVVLGSGAAVRAAIDRKAGGESITENDEVMALVRDIDDGNAWAVGRFDAIASRARLPQEVANQLPPINWFSASGYVNGGLRGLVRAEARDEQAAQNLRDVVRGFIALARLQTNAKPELNTMMNSFELGGDGRTVSVAFAIPPEIFDILGAARMRREAAPELDLPEPPEPPEPPQPPSPPPPRGL